MAKKLLFIIVEGVSDKNALEPILSERIDDTQIHFEII